MTIPVTRTEATKAGKVLSTIDMADSVSQEQQDALGTATMWRSQHVKATEACFSTVLDCASMIDDAIATYRMKRMTSIIRKLQRTSSHLRLGELDDIGGCRLIVDTIDDVNKAEAILTNRLNLKDGHNDKNYIDHPQHSGYRSRHLIAKIDDGESYRHVEIQIRTRLQHCWATANEAMGEIYSREYKSPQMHNNASETDAQRIEFFATVSSLFALHEGMPQVPGHTASEASLIEQLLASTCREQLLRDLEAATDSIYSVNSSSNPQDRLFLLKLSRSDQYLDISSFGEEHLSDALREYSRYETDVVLRSESASGENHPEIRYDNVVLVHVQKPQQLDLAYPNYSTNVRQFLAILNKFGIRP